MQTGQTIISVLISSPGDVPDDRDAAARAVEDLDRLLSRSDNVVLRVRRWEQDVSSEFGDHPQNVTDRAIVDDCDIFVGILCARFGTKTLTNESGTEQEFEKAFSRINDPNNPAEVLFYFKDPKLTAGDIDAEQLLKVQDFKKKHRGDGFGPDYKDAAELERRLKFDLQAAVERLLVKAGLREPRRARHPSTAARKTVRDELDSSGSADPDRESSRSQTETDPVPVHTSLTGEILDPESEDGLGMMELQDIVSERFAAVSQHLSMAGGSVELLGSRLAEKTDRLNEIADKTTRESQAKIKRIMVDAAGDINAYSDSISDMARALQDDFELALDAITQGVVMSLEDGLESQDDIIDFLENIDGLEATIVGVLANVEGFKGVIDRTPRITAELKKARRRASASTASLLEFFERSLEALRRLRIEVTEKASSLGEGNQE